MIDVTLQNEIISFTQEIIRTNSPSGEEEAAAKLIQQKMKALNYDDVQVDSAGNVIATRRGLHAGPVVLFDGHIDVVPVTNPEEWQSPPFSAEIMDGKIWGRGATDMKGPLAAAIITLGRLPADQFCGTLAVSASVGEEIHEGGAIAKVIEAVKPDYVIICEPSECCINIGQKGRAGVWVEVTGKSAHSASPHLGENAIYKSQPVIERLREMNLPGSPILGNGIMELIDAISSPYPSQSTLPVNFKMHYDRRLVEGETMDSILDSIKFTLKDLPDWQAGIIPIKHRSYTGWLIDEPDFHPGWSFDSSSPFVKKALAGLKESGLKPKLSTADYCTNGSYTAGVAKIPTIIFGPSSVSLAHRDNEYIEIKELLNGAEGYLSLARNLGSSL